MWQRAEDGEAVCMALVIRESPKAASISGVFTPPSHRRRGYASRLVATLSDEMLRAGKTACNLHTDLANATSNRVYVRVGYTQIWEFSSLRFS